MQLLSVLWVSSLWAILLVSLVFHAVYLGQSAAYRVQHEEQQALLEAFMRVACVRYQSDARVRVRVMREKQFVFHCELTQSVSDALSADIIYRLQPQGVHMTIMVTRKKSFVATAEHLFVRRAFAVAQKI